MKISFTINYKVLGYCCPILLFPIILVGCTSSSVNFEESYGISSLRNRSVAKETLLKTLGNTYISYNKEIQPILNKRCVVCHSCYDAPCQLNLSSIEGLDRGSHKAPVYNGSRFTAQEPTRLGFDADSVKHWRRKGFYPVLNERGKKERAHLENSILYQILQLKRRNPLPSEGQLPQEYGVPIIEHDDGTVLHKQQCTNIEGFSQFANKHPQWGMPFAFPGLNFNEFKKIEIWLKQGALAEARPPLSAQIMNEISKWESFFNGTSLKEKLVARYLYEHLFLGHLNFEIGDKNQFFKLVRSRSAPGQPIDIIATIRPYDDPGVDKFYYRLQRHNETIVRKTHLVYVLNDTKMKRLEELFITPAYSVEKLPSYDQKLASNPFATFVDLPAISRYKFMLDDAQFIIGGFIKGPVCRGQIALNVIDDHFWVVFFDPDKDTISNDSQFLASVSKDLRLPAEYGSDFKLLSIWTNYNSAQKQYLKEKEAYLKKLNPDNVGNNMSHIWNGKGTNKNTALTVYRHFDSATVLQGFIGEYPKTGWVLDYPLLERIHYLLVAGFNIYGALSHQLNTRLYMDFLRMEAENNFLSFLPSKHRKAVHNHWYRGAEAHVINYFENFSDLGVDREPELQYSGDDVKQEFFIKLFDYLGDNTNQDNINRCISDDCGNNENSDIVKRVETGLRKIAQLDGEVTGIFPDVAFVRIVVDGSIENDLVYSIIRNKAHKNVATMLGESARRIVEEDTIDIIEGFVGAYPNFFFSVDIEELEEFVRLFSAVSDSNSYEDLIEEFGVRRSNPSFWLAADWLHDKFSYELPRQAGIFDLNRYHNR